jgi:hypothetical protein
VTEALHEIHRPEAALGVVLDLDAGKALHIRESVMQNFFLTFPAVVSLLIDQGASSVALACPKLEVYQVLSYPVSNSLK